jgi:dephospho-CoA kinase
MTGKIALTGGIATGKTTVLGLIGRLGYLTDSADDISVRVFNRPDVRFQLKEGLGVSSLDDRAELRRLIAEDPRRRLVVNRLTHGEIWREIQACPAQFIEVPLLFETCLHLEFDAVWVVDCDETTRFNRLVERWGNEAMARQIIAAQLPQSVRLCFADAIIRTNHRIEDVMHSIASCIEAR